MFFEAQFIMSKNSQTIFLVYKSIETQGNVNPLQRNLHLTLPCGPPKPFRKSLHPSKSLVVFP